MFRKPIFASACAFIFASSLAGPCREAVSAPPQINATSPLGIRRGHSSELLISGANLAGNPRLIAPFVFKLDSPAPKGDASSWKLTLTIDAGTAVGVYPIRVQTDDGISNPFLLAVGQLPQVAEKEDNSTFETRRRFPTRRWLSKGSPRATTSISSGSTARRDRRSWSTRSARRIGSGVDPSIRLTSGGANRAYVASADDSAGLATDARLTALLPADGDYVVELSDSRYQGGGRPCIVW